MFWLPFQYSCHYVTITMDSDIKTLTLQTTTKFYWKHILALDDILQLNSFIYNIYLFKSSHKDVFPYHMIWMIASGKNYWNNYIVAHVSLKLYTPTGWFIILSINVAQPLKHSQSLKSHMFQPIIVSVHLMLFIISLERG